MICRHFRSWKVLSRNFPYGKLDLTLTLEHGWANELIVHPRVPGRLGVLSAKSSLDPQLPIRSTLMERYNVFNDLLRVGASAALSEWRVILLGASLKIRWRKRRKITHTKVLFSETRF